MGGKGGSTVVEQPQVTDNSGLDAAAGALGSMMQMNALMTQQMMSQQSAAQMRSIPEVKKAPEVDWKEKQDQLASKAKATYGLDQARRMGRMDTIHTSPLLDDEDEGPRTTESVLAGR